MMWQKVRCQLGRFQAEGGRVGGPCRSNGRHGLGARWLGRHVACAVIVWLYQLGRGSRLRGAKKWGSGDGAGAVGWQTRLAKVGQGVRPSEERFWCGS